MYKNNIQFYFTNNYYRGIMSGETPEPEPEPEMDSTPWNLIKTFQEPENATGTFSPYVEISESGEYIAFSERSIGVYVYNYDSTNDTWTQRGNTILATTMYSEATIYNSSFGNKLHISNDGNTIAICDTYSKQGAYHAGGISVFTYDSSDNTWDNILHEYGSTKNGRFTIVSTGMTSDGKYLVTGRQFLDDPSVENTGTLFFWDLEESHTTNGKNFDFSYNPIPWQDTTAFREIKFNSTGDVMACGHQGGDRVRGTWGIIKMDYENKTGITIAVYIAQGSAGKYDFVGSILDFTHDGQYLLQGNTGDANNKLQLWKWTGTDYDSITSEDEITSFNDISQLTQIGNDIDVEADLGYNLYGASGSVFQDGTIITVRTTTDQFLHMLNQDTSDWELVNTMTKSNVFMKSSNDTNRIFGISTTGPTNTVEIFKYSSVWDLIILNQNQNLNPS